MKTKLGHTLATIGLVIATFTFSNCGNGNKQGGSHNMGNHRSYQPMKDADMPGQKGSSTRTAPPSTGSHNMGNHRTYQPMLDEDMPGR